MSHSFTARGGKGATFHYNGGMDGDVTIVVDKEFATIATGDDIEVQISVEDLIEFVGLQLIDRLISKLQDIDVIAAWRRFR